MVSEATEVLTVKELAEFIKISPGLIRKLIRSNEIPFIKIKRRYIFRRSKIYQWLEQNSVAPSDSTLQLAEAKALEILNTMRNNDGNSL